MTSVSVSVLKMWPSAMQFLFQGKIVFDDAVMHHHDVAVAIAMRMRVFFGGTPVRGPARVPDAIRASQRLIADGFFQIAQFSGRAPQFQAPVAVQHGDARRIVAAVFQPPQTIQDDRHRIAAADVSHNSAHTLLQNFDPVVLNDRVRENIAGNFIQRLNRRIPPDPVRHSDFEVFPLPHGSNLLVPHSV